MILRVDLALILSLAICLNVIGVWMARIKETYVVPITVYLALVSLALVSIWTALTGETFVTYALPNSIVAWVICTQLYDLVHESFVKRKDRWKGLWIRIKELFTKEVTA